MKQNRMEIPFERPGSTPQNSIILRVVHIRRLAEIYQRKLCESSAVAAVWLLQEIARVQIVVAQRRAFCGASVPLEVVLQLLVVSWQAGLHPDPCPAEHCP